MQKKKILLTGARGMLGSDFQKYQGEYFEIITCDKTELDIRNRIEIERILTKVRPDIVLNCAAYTSVDDAEEREKRENFEVNTLGVSYLAQVCTQYQIDFVILSTDYVFDGEKKSGYSETDTPNPLSNYGIAKYLGEQLAQSIYQNTIIVRTSWLYGGGKDFKNFVNTILRLAATEKEIKVVDDQYGVPNWTYDVCLALGRVLATIESQRGRILHLSSSSENIDGISRADFAKYICQSAGYESDIIPCSSVEYGAAAKRPKYAVLLNHSDIQLPDWKISVKKYIKDIVL